jgi:hypothetical protein
VSTESAGDIAFSYFDAMLDGQDWISLPPGCPVERDELHAMACAVAVAVTRSSFMLDLLNGPGSKAALLRDLLARMWAAGYKAGSATTTAHGKGDVPRETKE